MKNPDFRISEVSPPTFSETVLDRRTFAAVAAAFSLPEMLQAEEPEELEEPQPKGIQFGARGAYAVAPKIRYTGTHPITLQATVTPTAIDKEMTIIGNHHSNGIALRIKGGFYEFTVHCGGRYHTVFSDIPAKPNVKTSVAGIYDGQTVRLYIDHKLQQSMIPATAKHKTSRFPLYIGADPNASGQAQHEFDGTIESVRVSACPRDKDPNWRKDPQCKPDKFDGLYLGSAFTEEGLWKDLSKYENHAELKGLEAPKEEK